MLRSLADQPSSLSLTQALRLSVYPRLALVGSGGKSTAMFQLAGELLRKHSQRELRPRGAARTVLLTTTTHLSSSQCRQADQHFVLSPKAAKIDLPTDLPAGVLVFTGPQVENERFSGVDAISLRAIVEYANVTNLPLLVEADGSRQRPLKAPDSHEPALLPFNETGLEWLDQVVVVVGLSGLGMPLSPEWVHRPEIYASLAMVQEGDLINLQVVSNVLLHPEGGLKRIPASVRKSALLNQADTPNLQAQAGKLADSLLAAYDSVVVASLKPATALTADGLGMPGFLAVREKTAGIILAAGTGERLGQAKQLLPWRGKPLVRHVAETALEASLDPVIVVVGETAQQVSSALVGLPVRVVHNPDWEAGQSASLQAGLRCLPENIGGCVFLLADQPQIPPGLVSALVEAHATSLAPVIAPECGGRRTNPVFFDRDTFQDLFQLTGDVGGRGVFSKYRPVLMPWHDSSILLDVDTLEDYQRLQELE